VTGREAALKALYDVDKNDAYCDKALKKVLADDLLSQQEKALATELVYGVTDKKRRLDYVISKYSKQKLKKISVWIINILRMGIYQLLFLDKIPESAAVNESVKLARRYGHSASAGFVNGILRNVARQGDVEYPDLSVYYSVPEWLDDMLKNQYGEKNTHEMYEAFSKPSPTTIRVNTLKTDAFELAKILRDNKVDVKETQVKNMLEISGFGDISKLAAYNDGLFTPQDISAYCAANMLDAKSGEFIIDVCAAPGGKTTQLAEDSNNKAKITAFDLYEHKVDIINNNCKRLGITCVNAEVWNSCEVNKKYIGVADKVMADVPCSGLGVIGKKFDIKWKKSPEDIKEIINVQKLILNNAAKYLKQDGILVYSTCTINKDENENVTRAFADETGFEIIDEKIILPTQGGDGFYICKLKGRKING